MIENMFSKTDIIIAVGFVILCMAIWILLPKLKRCLFWAYKKNVYIHTDLKKVDSLSGEEFEYFIKAHLEKQGYRADTTKRSHDYGCDLIVRKNNTTIVLQAKRHKSDIGIKAVQEILGAKNYYRADKAIVATNRFFTKPARELAKSAGIILWNRNEIEHIMNENPANIPVEEKQLPSPKTKTECPLCGSPMIRRNGKYGSFNGCSNYPLCKGTRK